MRRNYHTKLSGKIITGNYDLSYYVAQKCVNYRDTGVSKKKERSDNISIFHSLLNICQFLQHPWNELRK